MFARPYAPPERTAAMVSPRRKSGSINSPQAKHFQLFRSLPLTAAVPESSVFGHTHPYSAARPASAHHASTPLSARGSQSLPITPIPYGMEAHVSAPVTPRQPSAPPGAAPASSSAAASPISSPRVRSRRSSRPGSATGAAALSARSGTVAQEYQAEFLAAIQERQASEADRLTLFNRLQHLRAAEERAERHIEATAAQIAAVHTNRARHAREAAERKANEDFFYEQRAIAAQQMREQHAARRAAFSQYKSDLKAARRAQAALQREEQRELLQHRATLAAESLMRAQQQRAELLERTRLFHERQAMRAAHDAARVLEAKAVRIEVERARQQQAEDELAAMAAEEAALLARAQLRARMHQQRLDELAALVLVEDKRPTLRQHYTSMQKLMNREPKPKRNGATANNNAHLQQQQQAEHGADHLPHGSEPFDPSAALSSLNLSLPSAAAQQLIHGSAGSAASAAFGDEHKEESPQQSHALSDQQPDQQQREEQELLQSDAGFSADDAGADGDENGDDGHGAVVYAEVDFNSPASDAVVSSPSPPPEGAAATADGETDARADVPAAVEG